MHYYYYYYYFHAVNKQPCCLDLNILFFTAFFTSASCCCHLRRQRKHTVCSCTGEACWWTIHPASKQRSEGEKVRIGDDLILVSLSSERYLVRFFLSLLMSRMCVCVCVQLMRRAQTPSSPRPRCLRKQRWDGLIGKRRFFYGRCHASVNPPPAALTVPLIC